MLYEVITIVGFPGETEEDYNDTVKLIKEVNFDDAFMYKYNIRENTMAFNNFKDDVSDEEKNRRLSSIIELQKSITRKRKESRVGDILEVIPESRSKKRNNFV